MGKIYPLTHTPIHTRHILLEFDEVFALLPTHGIHHGLREPERWWGDEFFLWVIL